MTFARITPNWPAPSNVIAFQTCREGGFSHGPYASFNLGLTVGDEKTSVQHNRNLLQQEFHQPLRWLHQIHSAEAVALTDDFESAKADAIYTNLKHRACIVKTADCLPILLCNKTGTEIAAIHAGWRSLAAGIVTNTMAELKSAPSELLAWLGPAISQDYFEVGPEVKAAFLQLDDELSFAFKPGHQDRLHADLVGIAKLVLKKAGVREIYGGDFCTFDDTSRFFSYRRDHITGRMASVICLT